MAVVFFDSVYIIAKCYNDTILLLLLLIVLQLLLSV